MEILRAAGWPSLLLVLASVIGVAVTLERLQALRSVKVIPAGLLATVVSRVRAQGVKPDLIAELEGASPLGRVFAAGLRNERHSREVMKEAIEEAGRAAVAGLERGLGWLGSVATVSPLLGLFGTVVGMIELFGGAGANQYDPQPLAHGISMALYNTALGLAVAVPATLAHRLLRGRVDRLALEMEQQAIKLVEILHGDRQP